MKLNERIPGLPEWPPIEKIDDKNEYVVYATHRTFEGSRRSVGVYFFILLSLMALVGYVAIHDDGFNGIYMFVPVLPLIFFAGINRFTLLIEHLWFRRTTRVSFTATDLKVNGKKYEISSRVSIQFRANRPHLDEQDFNFFRERVQSGRMRLKDAFLMQLRKIEMIYGSRIVYITSIADPERAEQFAIALQIAFGLATSQSVNPIQVSKVHTFVIDDGLPE